MRINRIKIWGFKEESRVIDLFLSKNETTIIHGENGCGKTTLLEILFAIFNKDEAKLKQQNVKEIQIEYSENEVINHIRIFKKEYSEAEQDKFGYHWNEFEKSSLSNSSSVFFGINRNFEGSTGDIREQEVYNFIYRGIYRTKFDSSPQIIEFSEALVEYIKRSRYRLKRLRRNEINFDRNHLLLENIKPDQLESIIADRLYQSNKIISRRVQNALFDTMALAIIANDELPNKKINIDEGNLELITRNKQKLILTLENTDENILRDKIISILKNDSIEEVLLEDNQLLTKLLYNMIIELEKEETILQSINLIQEIFNQHLMIGKELIINDERMYIQTERNTHSIAQLSQGEMHLLSFLTLIIIEGRNRNFLIIDEPELSLNITWQRKFVALLNEIAPHSQIILASHSPSIVSNNFSSLAELK